MPSPPPTPTDETELRKSSPNGRSNAEGDSAADDRADNRAGTAPRRATHLFGTTGDEPVETPVDPDAPLSFVPHSPVEDTVRPKPLRIRTGRFGELEEHELVRLLDTIEDERARARFRESVYLSIFVWMAIALIALFGPKYLWHAPRVVLPSEVLRARELTQLTAPTLNAPHLRSAPPRVDSNTLDHLRSTEPKVAPPPRPEQPTPTPRAETHPEPRTEARTPPSPPLQPSTAPPNLPSAPAPQPTPQPVPRNPPPVVAEAPHPQPSRPDFNTGPQSAGESIQNALKNTTPGGGSPSGITNRGRGGSDLGMGPAEILSDTQGVNFNPYLQRILREIYDQWIPLIPEEARPPLSKSGITMIRFTILPDGTIGGMHLDGSTHDDALNHAAWGSITGVNQFPPLPSQFHGPNLELRIHYLVNRQTE